MKHQNLVTLEQARNALRLFEQADFCAPVPEYWNPYTLIYGWARESVILFRRYAAVVREVAQEKNVPESEVQQGLAEWEAQLRANHLNTEVDTLIRDVLFSGTEQVSLLSIMCGMGKSMAISYLIRDVVESQVCRGLLIATDSVERLRSYLQPAFDPELQRALEEHADKITLLESGNKQEALRRMRSSPVLLITTQRYFSMTVEEINDFLKGDGFRREYIIIDEKPIIKTVETVSRTTMNKVASALSDGIRSYEEQDRKREALGFWFQLRSVFERVIQQLEDGHAGKEAFYAAFQGIKNLDGHTLNRSDFGVFWQYVSRKNVRDQLKRFDPECMLMIERILKLMWHGGLFYGDRGQYYKSCFYMTVNRWDRLKDVRARVLVLDGTGDIHPDYDRQEGLHCVREGLPFRLLDNLTLHFVHVESGKQRLGMDDWGGQRKQEILKYLETLGHSKEKTPLFTYKEIERWFRNHGYALTGHFGDIKGRNNYADAENIIQVGMNLYANQDYMSLWLGDNPGEYVDLLARTENAIDEGMRAFRQLDEVSDLQNRILLAELEQNMFRCAIRRADCIKPVHFFVLCDVRRHEKLIEMASARYAQYAVNISVEGKVPEAVQQERRMHRKAKDPQKGTAYQRFMRWYEKAQRGTVLTKTQLLQATGLSGADFQNLLRKKVGSDEYRFPDAVALVEGMKMGRGMYRIP